MKHVAGLFTVVLLLAMMTVASVRTATPVYANCSGCYFTYPGVTCGPDSNIYLSVVSNAPGQVRWQVAFAASDGSIAFTGGSFNAGGSWYVVIGSRYMNSYDVSAVNGAYIVAHGPGCT
jgi:hypothetical protein